jgi:hypothetical protein
MILPEQLASRFKELRKQTKALARFKVLAPIILALQNCYLIFRYIRDYHETDKYLRSEWGSENANFIPIQTCKEIRVSLEKNMFAYNPTVCADGNELRFFTRITNVSNIPEANIFGSLKKRGALFGTVNGIAELKLDEDYNVVNYEEIIKPTGVPNFEDPKAFLFGNQVALFCNFITKEPSGKDRTFICANAIIELNSKKVTVLDSPFSKNIEKNWIPIDVTNKNLRMFYSCNPLTLLNVNLEDGLVSTSVLDQESENEFHGGSQLVRLTDDLLVRVVRRKMQMKKTGMVAISYLMFHDNDLKVILISKPFLFRKFGFEICNGLAKKDDYLVFTLGEDDIRNFAGRIKIDVMLSWAFDGGLKTH